MHQRRFGTLAAPTKARARASKMATLLRVHDARRAGAAPRDIAVTLFNIDPSRWRIDASSYRMRVQRMIAASRRMQRAGAAAVLRDGTMLAPFGP